MHCTRCFPVKLMYNNPWEILVIKIIFMNCRSAILFSPVAAIIMLCSCGEKKPPVQGPPPAVQVTLTTVTPTNAVYFDEYPGTISALNEIKLTAQVTGYVTGIHFKDGDKVKKGQLLYSLDE